MSLMQSLVSGEKVLWQGVPGRGIRFRRSDLFLIPFGLFFFGFAIFWETGALSSVGNARNAPPGFSVMFPLFGIPFILVGLYMVVGRFFWDAYCRRHSTYLLTNRRALIETNAFGRKLTSIILGDLPAVSLEERRDGSGSVVLGEDQQIGYGDNRRVRQAPRFAFISDAQRVYKLVEEARTKSRETER
jgi:hypothetical protein